MGWKLPEWEFSWLEIFRVVIVLGGNFPDGNCPGGCYPGWELSVWELSWLGIFFGRSFLGGNCSVGIIRVAICRVGVFMLTYFSATKI